MSGGSSQHSLFARRILAGTPELAQVWFDAGVLEKYRSTAGVRVIRTNTVGRVRGAQWVLDFGIAPDGTLIHASAGEIAERLPEVERAHWAEHVRLLPVSANYLTMQLTRGACIDDGDVRDW